ncbi:MAG: hypothetical protein GDA48_04270 [Hormoscilla sp. GM102CHS1]|nr:hypothetical protein [Hormoscilla sp. GM102CHS1]
MHKLYGVYFFEEITSEDFTTDSHDRRDARPTRLRATYPTFLLPVGMVKYSMFGVIKQNKNCMKSKDC